MATSAKDIYSANVYAANAYAAGVFRGIGVDVVVITTTNICFTDEYLSVSRMVDESLVCTRMIDESLEVCVGHAPATSMTLPQTDWYFSAGIVGGDGTSAANAWGTFSEVNQAIADSISANVGRWVKEYYEDASLPTVTSDTIADTWEAEFQAGRRRLIDGDVINLLTDMIAAPGDEQLNIEGTGITLRGAHGGIILGNRHDITGVTWTAHASVANVWQYAISGFAKTGLLEAGIALSRANHTVEASALASVSAATGGQVWSSATHVYLRPRTGSSNPNTDGRERFITITPVQTGSNPGIVAMGGGELLENLTVQGGPIWEAVLDGEDPIASVVRCPCVAITDGDLDVLSNVTIDGGSEMGVLIKGDGPTGFTVLDNITFRGLYTHGFSTQVGIQIAHVCQLTSDTSTGALRLIMRDCVTHSDGAWHNAGQAVSDTPPSGFHQFSFFAEAGGTPFKLTRFIDCDLMGLDVIATDRFTTQESDLLKVLGNPLDGLTRRTAFRNQIYQVEQFGLWKAELCKIVSAADVSQSPRFEAELWLDFCLIDLRLMATNALWLRSVTGGPIKTLRLTNCVIIAATGANGASLISGLLLTDVFSMDYCRLLNGSGSTRLLHDRNGSDLTFDQAVSAGLVTNSGAHASILLDAEYAPQAGSAVLGVADPANVETEDFGGVTGEVNRDDVGVWEGVA